MYTVYVLVIVEERTHIEYKLKHNISPYIRLPYTIYIYMAHCCCLYETKCLYTGTMGVIISLPIFGLGGLYNIRYNQLQYRNQSKQYNMCGMYTHR